MKVLVYNNFYHEGDDSALADGAGRRHQYRAVGPGSFRSNPYVQAKHIDLPNLLRRVISAAIVAFRSMRYNVLAVDSALTAALVACFLPPILRPRLIIMNFNVPRRRSGVFRMVGYLLFSRADHFVVHSRHDIELVSRLYGIPRERITFWPYVRGPLWQEGYSPELSRQLPEKFIFSFGGNARDYSTLYEAAEGMGISFVVAARDYNLAGLVQPSNVLAFTNISLKDCDHLVQRCLFTVFTFDGSEPSCGQISVVSSFMAGKPTVCTDWCAMHDYVTPHENGLFVRLKDSIDLKNKIDMLLSDDSLRQKLAKGASDWAASNVDVAALRRRMDDLVDKVMALSSQSRQDHFSSDAEANA